MAEMGYPRISLETRFWKKVQKLGKEDCWPWLGAQNGRGYGHIWGGNHIKLCKSHRVSYELYNGQIPEEIDVCHTCDNPLCVNPNHLFLGTTKDNMQDMVKKGRGKYNQKGELNNKAKLTIGDVAFIREAGNSGVRNYQLSFMLGVSSNTTSRASRGLSWV